MRRVFLKLIENSLIEKKKAMVDATVSDFRMHNLMEKAFIGLKQRWLKKSRAKLMRMVAKEFY